MARSSTKSGLGQRLSMLADAERKQSRAKLDKKPHFVPLDFSIVQMSLGHILKPEDLDEFYKKLIENIRASKFKILSVSRLNSLPATEIRKLLSTGPLVIEYNNTIIGALFSSFGSAGSNLFTPILNKTLSSYGKFDIGHLVSDSKLAKSPLQLTIEEVRGALDVYSKSKNRVKIDTHIANKIAIYLLTLYKTDSGKEEVIKELKKYGIVKDIDKVMSSSKLLSGIIKQHLKKGTLNLLKSTNIKAFEFYSGKLDSIYSSLLQKSSYGSTIIKTDIIKTISPTLSKIAANIVIIQDRAENQIEYGARIEAAVARDLKRDVITNFLVDERFSPSFIDATGDIIVDIILKKPVKTTSKKKSITIDASLPKEKNITKGGKQSPTVKGSIPPIRNIKGQFASLVSIETLIRMSLYETIKKNMVEPALVFRSGRFAASVQLQKLNAERDGSLIAFLTYMKYPYGTYEPGFAHGSVERSPTLLIDRSVREIATKLVTNRLKTVIV